MLRTSAQTLNWVIVVCALGLSACNENQWTGLVYPSQDDLTVHDEIGTYSSLEECRVAAQSVIRNAAWENPDYECALNCRVGSFPMICEETRR